jgi:hypothetical protein
MEKHERGWREAEREQKSAAALLLGSARGIPASLGLARWVPMKRSYVCRHDGMPVAKTSIT